MNKASRKLAAFVTNLGMYKSLVMFFGLTNSGNIPNYDKCSFQGSYLCRKSGHLYGQHSSILQDYGRTHQDSTAGITDLTRQ